MKILFKKYNLFIITLGLFLGAPVHLFGEQGESYYQSQFLFCIKKEIQPLIITRTDSGVQTDNSLINDFFQINDVVNIERWLPYANDQDYDGDIFLNRIYRIYISEESRQEVSDVKNQISDLSIVHSSELEYIRKTNPYYPSDPMLIEQCSMEALKAYDAWDFWDIEGGETPGDPSVLLASVDSGVEWRHPDLVDNIWQNPGEDADGDGQTIEYVDGEWVLDIGDINGYDDDGNGYPDDLIGWDPGGYSGSDDNDPSPPLDGLPFDWSHGTHVAGSLAATTDNSIGVAAAAFNSSILSVKCTRDIGDAQYITEGYSGILYSAKAGYYSGSLAIINNSWGGPGYSSYEQSVINNAHNTYGAVVVSSAGNDNYDLDSYSTYPAEYANVLNIAAVNCNGNKAGFTNYGTTIDLSSPGVGVLSTVLWGDYDYYDGTSMASPNASSCIGLLKSYYPDMDNTQLISRILYSADESIYEINPGYIGELGEGMVDCFKAIGYDIVPNLAYSFQNLLPITGDGDENLNPGESAELGIFISNGEGWTDAENVVGVLTCDNPGITIIEDTYEYGYIPSGGLGIHETDLFTFQVASDINIGDIPFTLTVTADGSDDYTVNKEIQFVVELSLNQSNWPQAFNQVQSSPLIMDIDNDGNQMEIIFGDNDGFLHVMSQDGQEMNGFPFNTNDDIWGSPAVADLDNDGNIEIVVSSKSKHLFILDVNGNTLVDYDAGQFLMGTPVIGNLDEDSDLEIAVGAYTGSGDIYAINYDGTDVMGFPFDFNEKVQGLALADLDNDDIDEIIYATESDDILGYISYNNGSPLMTTLLTAGEKFRSDPSVYSYNGEMYIMGGSDDYSMYCVKLDGNIHFQIETGGPVQTSPGYVIVDESTLGIFFGSQDEYLYGVDQNGEPLPGWPIDVGGKVNSSPVFSDMDGDGDPEVITATESGVIIAYHLDGSLLQNFPISFGISFISSPVIADIDLDGDLEIFIGSTSNVTGIDFKLNGSNLGYWNMFHGNPHRTSFYLFDPGSECGEPLLGDVNCDGMIDLLDIIIVVNIIHETEYTSEYELWSSDLNSDNSIDIYDIIIIIGIILND